MKTLQKTPFFWILSLVIILNLLPISSLAADESAAPESKIVSGTYGELTWHYDSDTGILTISGKGDMPDSEPMYDDYSDDVFYEDIPWRTLDIRTVQIETGVTGIGSGAFTNCSTLTDIHLSDTVSRIGEHAFYGCTALKELRLPKSVTSIESYALSANGLNDIHVESDNPVFSSIDGVLFNTEQDLLVTFPSSRSGHYTIPDHTATIGIRAFYLSHLNSITIPSGVRRIEYSAFYKSSLQTASIQEGAAELAQDCFRECTDLKQIVLPDSITEIPDRAFFSCKNLSSVTLGNKTASIGFRAFGSCNSMKEITVPKSVTAIGSEALGYSIRLSYDIQESELLRDFTIKGYRNTAAETYARENNITFRALDPAPVPKITSLTNEVSGVQVKWSKISGTAKYRVYRKTGAESWKRLCTTTSGTFTDKTVKSGTTYTYTVRGVSADEKRFTTDYDKKGKNIRYLDSPRLESVKNTSSGVCIKWKKVTGTAQYRVFRKSGSGSWKRLGNTTSVSFTDKTAKNGTSYTYTVRCLSADGKKYTSSHYKGKAIFRLSTPSISSLRNVKSKKMTLKWSKNTSATGYQIQYATNKDFSKAKTVTISKNSTFSATISKLTKQKKYYVRIRSCKKISKTTYYSGWSSSKTVTIKK